jgi:prepilin-type N-terminal cleavage/methylation domain-containing protein
LKSGFTLVQLLVVLGIISLLAALALPRLNGSLDRIAVQGASADIAAAFALARQAAITRSQYSMVRIDSLRRSVTVAVGSDTLLVRLLGTVHGVEVRSNRDSLSYDPLGHGYGAANQSIVVSRGSLADTVVISRLGRVRYRG